MPNKEFVVFGLSKFGISVAEHLESEGCEVLAVDINEDKIQEIRNVVTHAVRADVTDKDALERLGIRNFDGAIVAVSGDLEASIMATILAKEIGVKNVIAKAQNDMHAKVLRKVGADDVIFPEKEMGARTARRLISGNFMDLVELSDDISIVEMPVPEEWVGKNLLELAIREKYGVNMIAIKRGDIVDVSFDPSEPIEKDVVLVLMGENGALQKI